MANAARDVHKSGPPATPEEVKRILGDLEVAKLLEILALNPTVRDIEHASLWLAGDTDIFGAGAPLKGVAGDVVAIVTADEEEEEPRRS